MTRKFSLFSASCCRPIGNFLFFFRSTLFVTVGKLVSRSPALYNDHFAKGFIIVIIIKRCTRQQHYDIYISIYSSNNRTIILGTAVIVTGWDRYTFLTRTPSSGAARERFTRPRRYKRFSVYRYDL